MRLALSPLPASNVFLARDNMVRLGDFGIARVLAHTLDQAKTVVGTPYYMSPEVCADKHYGERSDVWALGCVLYEMATLQHPFQSNNLLGLVHKIVNVGAARERGAGASEGPYSVTFVLSTRPVRSAKRRCPSATRPNSPSSSTASSRRTLRCGLTQPTSSRWESWQSGCEPSRRCWRQTAAAPQEAPGCSGCPKPAPQRCAVSPAHTGPRSTADGGSLPPHLPSPCR